MSKLTYNLPLFRDFDEDGKGRPFPDPVERGVWRKAQGSLADLGASLQVGDGGTVDGVKSVPDPWAQPRTFADAVTRKGHPQAEASIGQWRGMLALFALESVYSQVYSLSLTKVILTDSKSPLARVLCALPPRVSLPQKAGANADGAALRAVWTEPVLIQLRLVSDGSGSGSLTYDDPITLGMMNPVCLVSPGRASGRISAPQIEWMRTGLCDPTKLEGSDRLSDINLGIIREYVQQIISDLDGIAEGDSALLTTLRSQLVAFRQALQSAGRTPFKIVVGSPQSEGRLPPLYAMLRRQITTEVSDPVGVSECLIKLRVDLPADSTFKGVILVDRQIATTRGKPANNVCVWGKNTLTDLSDRNRFRQVQQEAAAKGYLLIRREQLFTPTFAQLGRDAVIPGNPGDFSKALVPLSPLALLLLNPDALAGAISLRWDGGDRCVATLNLALEGVALKDGGYGEWASPPVEHGLAQTYAVTPSAEAGEGVLRKEVNWTYGDVAIWPNFVSADWANYFARLTFSKKGERVRGRFALSGAAIADYLSDFTLDQREGVFTSWLVPSLFSREAIEPFARRELESRWVNRMRSTDNEVVVEELQTSSHAFEAIFFTATEAAGLVLLKTERLGSPGDSGVVGIDFGTTNTVACLDDGNPVVFKDRVLHPIGSTDLTMIERSSDAMRWTFVDFLPPVERHTPTPTVVLDQIVDKAEELRNVATLEDDRILFSHVIYFQPETATTGNRAEKEIEEMKDVLGRARFNLKWDDDDLVRQAAHRFLRQLMLMVAAEALEAGKNLERLDWRFSRPDAMEDSHDEFRATMKKRLKQIVPGADVEARVKRIYSEAEAAGIFILNGGGDANKFKPGTLNIILDIGGGTTDITFWKFEDPIWKGSYKLAGGDFFTSYIVNNPAFLDLFGLEGWSAILGTKDGAKKGISTKRLFVGELLFSGSVLADALKERWTDKSGRDEAKALVRSGFVFLGGLAFYLGLVARRLIEQGKMSEEVLESVTFALCGRGAGLFSQLHYGGPQSESAVSRLLTLFSVGAGQPEAIRPSVFRSPQPKLEVARGMVMADVRKDQDGKPAMRNILTTQPSGIRVPVGEEVFKATDPLEGLPMQGAIGKPDLAEFDRFVEALSEHGRFRIDLAAGGAQSAASGIRNAVIRAVGDAQKPTIQGAGNLFEPLFVTALRALLSEMTAPRGASQLNVVETKKAG